jgi:hypothetical protein
VATIAGGVVGVATIWSDNVVHIAGQSLTASVVTLSALGALLMYIISMAALFRLRANEPDLQRPFKAPLYPLAPAFALGMAALAFVTMIWNNREIAAIFAVLMVVLVIGALAFRQRGLESGRRTGGIEAIRIEFVGRSIEPFDDFLLFVSGQGFVAVKPAAKCIELARVDPPGLPLVDEIVGRLRNAALDGRESVGERIVGDLPLRVLVDQACGLPGALCRARSAARRYRWIWRPRVSIRGRAPFCSW